MDVVTNHGMKLKIASQMFGILTTSFRDHLYSKTRSKQRGDCPTLKPDEKKKLVDYIFESQNLGHPLILAKLCLKVALTISTKETCWSATGLPSKDWLRRFRFKHSEIATRKSQGLEVARACALYLTIAEILCANLEALYMTFHYHPSHIWNCDKSSVQARRSGGVTVLANRSSRSIHSIEPSQ